jgi:hypothetical protein
MKRMLVLAGLVAGLSGCTSTSVQEAPLSTPSVKLEPLLKPFSSLDAQAQYERLTSEMGVISAALQAYSRNHNGALPPRLTALVSGGYLPAAALVSSADPSCGKEGGVPDSYREWGQASETDEKGSSYLYEFSEAPCQWDWKSYMGGKPDVKDVDTNKDGKASWAEVKSWQLLHGDTVQKPESRPYSVSQFPVVRCYWLQYPNAYTNISAKSVVNLAADLRTIFVSQPWWEKDL